MLQGFCTHAEDAVDAGVVAAVAHGEPVEHKEHDVDVLPAGWSAVKWNEV